jgi:hypothetical protein
MESILRAIRDAYADVEISLMTLASNEKGPVACDSNRAKGGVRVKAAARNAG